MDAELPDDGEEEYRYPEVGRIDLPDELFVEKLEIPVPVPILDWLELEAAEANRSVEDQVVQILRKWYES